MSATTLLMISNLLAHANKFGSQALVDSAGGFSELKQIVWC